MCVYGSLGPPQCVIRWARHTPQVMKYFKSTAPLYDNYYPMIVKTNCLLNAPNFFAAVWSWLKQLFSKELQETVQIYGKGKSDHLLSFLRATDVPACYGGALTQMPSGIIKMYGLDVVLEREPWLAPHLFPGSTSRLARFHLPPDQAELGGSRRGSGDDKDGSGKGLGEGFGDSAEGTSQLHVAQVEVPLTGGLAESEPIEPRGQHHPQLLAATGISHDGTSAPGELIELHGARPAVELPPEFEDSPEKSEEDTVKQLRQTLDARGFVCGGPQSALPRYGETVPKMLARVLRGKPHSNSVPHAVERIASYAKWREDNLVDTWPLRDEMAIDKKAREILGCDRSTIKAFLPHGRAGVDRVGRPVLFKHLGRQFVVKSMVKHASLERLLEYNCYFQEQNLESDEAGNLKQWVSVIDVAGMHFGMFSSEARKLLYRIGKRDESFYADVTAMIIIVNAPPSFAFVWRVARSWMEPSMRERTHIVSERTPEQATQLLTRLIDPSQLPANYGGDAPPFDPWPESDRGPLPHHSTILAADRSPRSLQSKLANPLTPAKATATPGKRGRNSGSWGWGGTSESQSLAETSAAEVAHRRSRAV